MATNLKIERLAGDVYDALWMRLYAPDNTVPVISDLDATGDRYLKVTDGKGTYQLVRFETTENLANNLANVVTGGAQSVFTPHVIQCGFNAGLKATDTVTLTGAVATKTITIDTTAVGGAAVVFTAKAAFPLTATDQFVVSGNDKQDAAELARAINASTTTGIAGMVYAVHVAGSAVVSIYAYAAGEGGNSITVVSNDGSMVVNASPLAGGTSGGATPSYLRDLIMVEVARKGPEVRVYEAEAQIVLADLIVANLVWVYRNTEWGNLSHI